MGAALIAPWRSSSVFDIPGAVRHELDEFIEENQYRTRQAVNCFVFEDAAYLVIEELTVRNCWPTSFVFVSSRYVTVRAATIVGSTYAVFVNQRSDHVLVEDSVWTQDDSGYAADESGASGRVDLKPRPGRMWDTVPWGVSHHGSRAHLNGGLVGSFGSPAASSFAATSSATPTTGFAFAPIVATARPAT